MISIIIPIYNVEMYIKECIDSVLMQTYQNFEILLIDDGSTDSSGKLCDEIALTDFRIKVFISQMEVLHLLVITGWRKLWVSISFFLIQMIIG